MLQPRLLFALLLLALIVIVSNNNVHAFLLAQQVSPTTSPRIPATTLPCFHLQSPSAITTTTASRTHYHSTHNNNNNNNNPTTSTTTCLFMNKRNNQNMEVVGKDRILSCLPYLLPLLDGDSYGRFIYRAIPPLGMADALLLGPLKLVYGAIPFLGLICFFGLTFLARNQDIPASIRFNMQQAVIMDIILIFPSLLGQLFGMSGMMGLVPRFLVESGSNFVFYCLVASVGYALVSNLTGKRPNQIPIISQAAELQIGMF